MFILYASNRFFFSFIIDLIRKLFQVIIGNGNVALDCSRVILSCGTDRLLRSDIPASILDTLSRSQIRHVTIVGRKGLLDVSFVSTKILI